MLTRIVIRSAAAASGRIQSRLLPSQLIPVVSQLRPSCLYLTHPSRPIPSSSRSLSTNKSMNASDNSSTSSSTPRSSFTQPPLNKPPSSTIANLIGGAIGIYLAFVTVNFVNDKLIDPAGAAERQGRTPPPQEKTSPYPYLKLPAMDYRTHTLSEIFGSFLQPLIDFDRGADEFSDRKDRIEIQMEGLAARRKTGKVPAAEIKAIEAESARIESEERNIWQPKLAEMAELYFRRNQELMERSQMLAEKRFAIGQAILDATTPEAKAAAQLEADRVRVELDREMSEFQTLAQSNQHLLPIVLRYGLKGQDFELKKELRDGPKQSTENATAK